MVILEENFKWHLEVFASELFIYINIYTLQSKFGSNMDKPKCWGKNAIKKCTVESEN